MQQWEERPYRLLKNGQTGWVTTWSVSYWERCFWIQGDRDGKGLLQFNDKSGGTLQLKIYRQRETLYFSVNSFNEYIADFMNKLKLEHTFENFVYLASYNMFETPVNERSIQIYPDKPFNIQKKIQP